MPDFYNKSETECLETVQMSEKFMHRYMKMLARFSDLPACDEIVMREMEKEFPKYFLESLLTAGDELPPEGEDDADAFADNGEGDMPMSEGEESGADGKAMSRLKKLYRSIEKLSFEVSDELRIVSNNWGVIQVMLFPTDLKSEGLDVLVGLARILGTVQGACESLRSANFNMAVVLARRSAIHAQTVVEGLKKLLGLWKPGRDLFEDRIRVLAAIIVKLNKMADICVKISECESGLDY